MFFRKRNRLRARGRLGGACRFLAPSGQLDAAAAKCLSTSHSATGAHLDFIPARRGCGLQGTIHGKNPQFAKLTTGSMTRAISPSLLWQVLVYLKNASQSKHAGTYFTPPGPKGLRTARRSSNQCQQCDQRGLPKFVWPRACNLKDSGPSLHLPFDVRCPKGIPSIP